MCIRDRSKIIKDSLNSEIDEPQNTLTQLVQNKPFTKTANTNEINETQAERAGEELNNTKQNENIKALPIVAHAPDILEKGKLYCSLCEEDIADYFYNECTVCKEFHICRECTEDLLHDHLLTPRFPENKLQSVPASFIKPHENPVNNISLTNHLHASAYIPQSIIDPSIKIQCIGESNVQKEVAPYESFAKSWTFVNSGKAQWPDGMLFTPLGGNLLNVEVERVPQVFPGKKCTITIKLIAPETPGHHKQYFTMQKKGKDIGEKVWAEIDVVDQRAIEKKRAEEVLLSIKKEQYVPEDYEANFLKLLLISNEDPKWILTLLKDNNNDVEVVTELLLT
eukprot:TRINITY_DN1682_c0_g1_i4.p1 TRINITY_DN1682_c0_g1~~TRINITY_DN1682_c0_g1_i4.p1  ORF type:complete len:338 (+),score=27.33 TRINITY_DN1682_c0_g1_i4:76-1089(+)